jgi:hypothetical protein
LKKVWKRPKRKLEKQKKPILSNNEALFRLFLSKLFKNNRKKKNRKKKSKKNTI